MRRQVLFDGSPRTFGTLGTDTDRSRIGVSRHRIGCTAPTYVSAPVQDAHLVILQLRDQPAHDFWADGRHIPIRQAEAGSMGIVDLRQKAEAVFGDELDSLHLHLPLTALEDLADELETKPATSFSLDEQWMIDDRVAQQFTPLLAAVAQADMPPARLYVDHLVLAFATHIAGTYGGMRPSPIRSGGLAPWQVRRARDMLAADLTGATTIAELAAACGLSQSYFARAFKVSTGCPPHAWLQALRIEKARTLLLGDLPLADIALRSGFTDQSHFTRVFKAATGETPAAWRRLRRNG